MNDSQFVGALMELAPSKEDFRQSNIPFSLIDEFSSRYLCRSKNCEEKKGFDSSSRIPIIDLLRNYDCSNVGIGILGFIKDIEEYADYFIIGFVDVDVLVLNKVTLEVEVRDHDELSYVIWPCASNGSSMLDSLIYCAQYFKLLLVNGISAEKELLTWVDKCTSAAGGYKYENFYKMLLGYFR